MKFINKYLRNIQPYSVASHKIWDIPYNEQKNVLKLDWNEATIPPSPKVKERLLKLVENENIYNLYPSVLNKELLQSLSQYVGLSEENIQCFASSDILHEYIAKVYMTVDTNVLILGPSYDNFRLACQASGAEIYYSAYNDDFTFDANNFYNDVVKIKPTVIYICNPNNPTGNIHSVKYIESLLNEFSDTLFILDEAYYEFSGVTAKNLVLNYDNILVSRTMSKAFALANFRIGYLIASAENIRLISNVRNAKSLSTFAQEAAIAVLSDLDYMKKYVAEVNKAKLYFTKAMKRHNNITLYNGEGNFVLIKMSSEDEKKSICSFLSEHNIFVRELSQSIKLKSCFRITIGTISQMERVVSVIDDFFKYGK
ncbi:MAG: histidinol-phosphate aminotransferase family protein [Prevotellaceae bacterium]|jgi:histidinol-phosphate aminotransferase|nr:histidinol-phosphate aminotransferase family protein [Prevotellaceae bacterium]